jgi:hypothetical protein
MDSVRRLSTTDTDADALVLHEDRFFDPDPSVRSAARALYEETRDLPLICPHGHVDPALLAKDEAFPEPTALILVPDHYIFRMLYSQGVPMEAMGVPTRDGTPVETDPRRIWRTFGERYHLFRGTPTGAWLDHELYHVFACAAGARAVAVEALPAPKSAAAPPFCGKAFRSFSRRLQPLARAAAVAGGVVSRGGQRGRRLRARG